ncbi:MAG: hypothetical protein JSS07_00895 [Proteobacteria bacterium]|nr:hypothetical protein [Pseudomonadota bacterium]
MSKEGSTGKTAMDHFKAVRDALLELKTPTAISSLGEGDLRRYFNEALRHRDNKKYKEVLDDMNIQKKHQALIDDLISSCGFDQITGTFVTKVEKLFQEFDKDLTDDPEWYLYWEDQEESGLDPIKSEEMQKKILEGYRFKMLQQIGFRLRRDFNAEQSLKADKALQQLNSSYTNFKGRDLYKDVENKFMEVSAQNYVQAINSMLKAAIERYTNNPNKEDVKENDVKDYLKEQLSKIFDDNAKTDYYAIFYGKDKAKQNLENLFSINNLFDKVKGYSVLCRARGYDINERMEVLEEWKKSAMPDDSPLQSSNSNDIEDYGKVLKAFVYYKEDKKPTNAEIFSDFDGHKELDKYEKLADAMIANIKTSPYYDVYMGERLSKFIKDGNHAKVEAMKYRNNVDINKYFLKAVQEGKDISINYIQFGADPNVKTNDYNRTLGTKIADAFAGLFSGNFMNNWRVPPLRKPSEIAKLLGHENLSAELIKKESEIKKKDEEQAITKPEQTNDANEADDFHNETKTENDNDNDIDNVVEKALGKTPKSPFKGSKSISDQKPATIKTRFVSDNIQNIKNILKTFDSTDQNIKTNKDLPGEEAQRNTINQKKAEIEKKALKTVLDVLEQDPTITSENVKFAGEVKAILDNAHKEIKTIQSGAGVYDDANKLSNKSESLLMDLSEASIPKAEHKEKETKKKTLKS